MKSIQLAGPYDLRLAEVERPHAGPGEMVIAVRAASICGSDVRMYKNGYKHASEEHPLTLGHEFAGVIDELGEGVPETYAVGDAVCAAPNYGCGTCDACVSGNTHLCADYHAFGIDIPGGFAEFVHVPAQIVSQGNVAHIPEGLSFAEAALVEPLSCVFNGQEICGIESGDTVVVVGAGPIGIMHCLLARARGAAKIILNDLNEERVRAAAELIGDIVALPGEGLGERVMAETGGAGANVIIIAAPAAPAQHESLEYAAMNGRCLFFGGLPAGKSEVALDANLIHYKQLRIFGSARSNVRQFRTCLELVAGGNIPLGNLITKRYAIDDFQEAFDAAAAGTCLKNVIEFAG